MQLGLPVIWTAARARGHALADVVRWMATAPADRVGLSHKGRIEVGADADLCVLAPDAEFVVDPQRLLHKNPISAYAGRRLTGVVRQTWLRGTRVDIRTRAARPAPDREDSDDQLLRTARRPARPDRADHRPGDVHRGVRGAAQGHDARHRHQQPAVLGRHPAVGDRPSAVRLRRDVLAVHRRGGQGRRQRPSRGRPGRRGSAVRRRRLGAADDRRHRARARARRLRLPAARRARGRCATPGRRPRASTGSASPTSGRRHRRARSRS